MKPFTFTHMIQRTEEPMLMWGTDDRQPEVGLGLTTQVQHLLSLLPIAPTTWLSYPSRSLGNKGQALSILGLLKGVRMENISLTHKDSWLVQLSWRPVWDQSHGLVATRGEKIMGPKTSLILNDYIYEFPLHLWQIRHFFSEKSLPFLYDTEGQWQLGWPILVTL